jgi:nitric oxide reductase NorE protein
MSVSSPAPPASASDAATGEARHPERRLPGDAHMWVMVLGEFFVFGSYFVVYLLDRAASSPEAYAASQAHLNVNIGVLNTVILLTSSLFVALAVIDTKHGDAKGAERKVLAASGCGLLFVAIKAYEWYQEAQYYSIDDEFLSHYYGLTGVHLFHMLVGFIVLGALVRELRDPRRQRLNTIEQGALYWHMIDVIWVLIFAVLYLMR